MNKRFLLLAGIIVLTATQLSLTAEETYTYDANIKSITEGTCNFCHDFAASYETVMARPGFVVPGEPDASEFVWRIEGEDILGDPVTRMPNDGPYLSDATIQIIRAWIAQGAIKGEPIGVQESTRWLEVKELFEK